MCWISVNYLFIIQWSSDACVYIIFDPCVIIWIYSADYWMILCWQPDYLFSVISYHNLFMIWLAWIEYPLIVCSLSNVPWLICQSHAPRFRSLYVMSVPLVADQWIANPTDFMPRSKILKIQCGLINCCYLLLIVVKQSCTFVQLTSLPPFIVD